MTPQLRIASVLLWIAAAGLGHRAMQAPTPDPDRARALMALHASLFDDTPRPTGSPAASRARRRIADALDAAGCPVQVQRGWSCSERVCSDVSNLWCRVGPATGPAVVGMAHTDSVAAGPGAADDGAGVVAWIDTVQRLDPATLKRPLVVLLTDAEEVGLLGARLFFADPPVEVGEVINLEARGTSGASAWFEAVGPPRPWGRWYAATGLPPRANSAYPAIYDRMPNGTDLTVVGRAGLPGINHAFIGGLQQYHTPLDDRAHLDRGSLVQQADIAMGWVRTLQDRAGGTESAVVDVVGRVLLRWPVAGSWPLLIGLALAWAGVLALDLRGGRTPGGAVVRALGAGLGIGAASCAIVEILGAILGSLAGPVWWGSPAAVGAVVVSTQVAVGAGIGAVAPPLARWHAAVAGLLGMGFAGAVLDPRLSVPTVPVIAGALAWRTISWRWPTAGIAGLAPLCAAGFVPLALGLQLALTLQHPALVAVPVGLALVGLAPAIGDRPGRVAAAGGIALALSFAVAVSSPPFTAERPQPILVHHEEGLQGAVRWTRAVVGVLPTGQAHRRDAVPPAGLPGPALRWISPTSLHVAPVRGGWTLVVDGGGPFEIDGGAGGNGRTILTGVGPDGIRLTWSSAPTGLRIAERTVGVPRRRDTVGEGPTVPIHWGDQLDVWIAPVRDGAAPGG